MILEWYHYLLAIFGGFCAGIINTLAGNGSAITLSILFFLNLPADIANGTNRVGILSQTSITSWMFYKNGKLKLESNLSIIVPCLIGAIGGVFTAIWIDPGNLKMIIGILMVLMLGVILIKPKRWIQESDLTKRPSLWIVIPIALVLGFYGGFIQMGMGLFFLAFTVLVAKQSLVDANVLKSFVVFVYTIVVLAIFASQGLIDWKIGGLLAIGQSLGAVIATRFAINNPKANVWIHRLLVVVVISAIVKLFFF